MAETERVQMDDKDLFASAMAPDAPQEQPAAQPSEQAPPPEQLQPQEPPRDEQGRFVARQEQEPSQSQAPPENAPPPEQKPAVPPPEEGAQVPSWRLREMREEREAAIRHAQEQERIAQWYQQQAAALQRQVQPQKPPDMFENPQGFVEHGVRQAVDPVQAEIANMREFYSRRDAVNTHGEETVRAAYNAMGEAIQRRDPEAVAVYQHAMSTMDPYGIVMDWHNRRTIAAEIGDDPDGYIKKSLDDWIENDAEFRKWLFERMQQKATTKQPDGRPAINLPPSLNRTPGQAATDTATLTDADMSDKALFRYAMSSPRR